MDVVEPNWMALLVFSVAWVATCVAGFFVSGSLPLAMAPENIQSGGGRALVVFNVAVLLSLAVATILYGIAELRWASLILAGGAVFLFSPLVIDSLPASLKDTKLGHFLMLAIVALGFATLFSMGAVASIHAYLAG